MASKQSFTISRELLEKILYYLDSLSEGDVQYDNNLVALTENDRLYDELRNETGHTWDD